MQDLDWLPTAQDVAAIRKGMDLSQSGFAALLRVALRTVQGWESGKRLDSAGRVLLLVAKHQPEAITKAANMAGQTQEASKNQAD